MVKNIDLKELYQSSVKDDLDFITQKNQENKIMQRIRENSPNNWKIVEACREIMFENAKIIGLLKEQIENEHRKIKEFS